MMHLEVESRHVGMTPRWRKEIKERMAALQRGHDDLVHGRVTLTKNPHHKKSSNVAEALLVVSLPGRHTISARKGNKTFEEAIRTAFEAVGIELRKFREKRAKKELRSAPLPPLRGVVCKLFPREDYGFILQEGGGEVYFHRNALRGLSFQDLEDGSEVLFNVEDGQKGPQATVVRLLPPTPR